jgi:hypothetical protein
VGHSYGVGRIAQDPMNPYVRILDRALVTQQSQNTFQKTNSTTVETFVKFWFVNDTVIKWETYGVDYSRPIPIISNETNQPTTKPDFASEFLYYEVTDKKFMYSHNSLLRMNNGGVNGPLTFYEADSLHKYHQDFISTLIPSIDQLKKVYDSNSKLRYILLRNSFVVWSSSRSASGNILCMNFRSGDIVENSPDSKCYFVPLVPLNGQ